jgi:hypothetical protein
LMDHRARALEMLLLGLLSAGAFASLVAWIVMYSRARAAKINALREALAGNLGLVRKKTRRLDFMAGSMGGIPVEVVWELEVVSTGKSTYAIPHTRYLVAVGLPISVRKEGIGTSIRKAISGSDLTVGDPVFDAACYLAGDPVYMLAACSARSREALLALVKNGRAIDKGKLVLVTNDHLSEESAAHALLDPMIEAAAALRFSAGELPGRLASNAVSDPVMGVRLRCLTALVVSFPDHPETVTACEAAQKEGGPLRVAAALHQRDSGFLAAMEQELIAMLHSEDPKVTRVAIDALALAGTIAAVEALHKAPLKTEAAAAIAAIQGRAAGAAGELSVAGSEAVGQLSEADGKGQLSEVATRRPTAK